MEDQDARAVARVLAGEQDAFQSLVERHSRTIFRLAYRMTGNEQDADEVVQDTFLKAYKRLDKFEARSSFGTWVYRIAANCALDLITSRQQYEKGRVPMEDPEEPGMELQLPSNDPDPERQMLSSQLGERLAAVMETLTGAERTAFVMRHHEGKSIEEIAEVLGIRIGAAKNSVFRAVQKLRVSLEPALRSAR